MANSVRVSGRAGGNLTINVEQGEPSQDSYLCQLVSCNPRALNLFLLATTVILLITVVSTSAYFAREIGKLKGDLKGIKVQDREVREEVDNLRGIVDLSKGEKGDTGEKGLKGPQGPQGAGRQGVRGEKGDTGEKGLRGRQGPQGAGRQGDRGYSGRKGDPGERGAKGDTGLKGSPGPTGYGQKGQRGLRGGGGSEVTVWGRTNCPSTSSLIYHGVVGGNKITSSGGGVGYLCLPLNPQWQKFNNSASWVSWMASVEYVVKDYGLLPNSLHQKRAVCARCYTESRPAVMMIPARTSCDEGWTREYYGYLMTNQDTYHNPSNYVCVHNTPTSYAHSHDGHGGGLVYVNADCAGEASIDECDNGQYVNNRQLTCVVCSR